MNSTIRYMHTLNDKPAYFCGYQIVYASHRGKPCKTELDRETIKRQQTQSRRWRRENNMSADLQSGYGWVRVSMEARSVGRGTANHAQPLLTKKAITPTA